MTLSLRENNLCNPERLNVLPCKWKMHHTRSAIDDWHFLLLRPQRSALFLPWPCGRVVCLHSAPSSLFIHMSLTAPGSQEKPCNSSPLSNQQRGCSRQFLLPLSDTFIGNQAQLWDLEHSLMEESAAACDYSSCSSTPCPTSASSDALFGKTMNQLILQVIHVLLIFMSTALQKK